MARLARVVIPDHPHRVTQRGKAPRAHHLWRPDYVPVLRRRQPNLPEFVAGGKTTGVLQTENGNVTFQSGWGGPATSMPPGSPGFDIVTRTYVEGQAQPSCSSRV
jgi:hypothetical protein